MQGYLLSRPFSAEAMTQLLHRHFHSEPLSPAAEDGDTATAGTGSAALH
jgi:hypothetical protein